jgi:hypothetical protein
MGSAEYIADHPSVSIGQARHIIEDQHALSWFDFAFADHPEAISHDGPATVDTQTLFDWLGY